MPPIAGPRCGHLVRGYKGQPPGVCGLPEGHPGRHLREEKAMLKAQRHATGRKLGTLIVRTHGYGGYTNGCRCETCRDAKADYVRQRRADAYVTDTAPESDPTVTHGTRFAYEERGCRCETCVAAERVSSRYPERSSVA